MSERRKTFIAAAALAAAVGVYVEVSYHEKLRAAAELDALRGSKPLPVPASSVPRPTGSTERPH